MECMRTLMIIRWVWCPPHAAVARVAAMAESPAEAGEGDPTPQLVSGVGAAKPQKNRVRRNTLAAGGLMDGSGVCAPKP